MHWSGIDRHKKPCLANERGQGEQICLSREIDDFVLRPVLNCSDMRLLVLGRPTGQNKIDTVVSTKVLNHFCPSLWFPKFLLPR